MNAAGLLLVLAGTWVVSQVFAGDALRRMNITPNASNPRSVDSGGSGSGPGAAAGGAIGGAVGGVPGAVAGSAAGNAYDGLWNNTPVWARPFVFPAWYIASRKERGLPT